VAGLLKSHDAATVLAPQAPVQTSSQSEEKPNSRSSVILQSSCNTATLVNSFLSTNTLLNWITLSSQPNSLSSSSSSLSDPDSTPSASDPSGPDSCSDSSSSAFRSSHEETFVLAGMSLVDETNFLNGRRVERVGGVEDDRVNAYRGSGALG
jgi:hypothetical protein